MSKQLFIQEVEKFQGQLSEGAREYFQKTLKAKKVNKKEVEKATAMKSAIVEVLSKGQTLNRVEIMTLIEKLDLVSPEYLYNDKDELSFNSITAFANQLVLEGKLIKQETKQGKAKVVKYRLV
jgi:hypothetical protein